MSAPRNRRFRALWAVAVILAGVLVYALALDPALWTGVGDRHLRAGELVAAERSYQRALRIDADHAPALYGLGWSYLRAGLLDEAQVRFQRAVLADATYPLGYRGMAAVAAARGRAEEAEQELRTAHELDPTDPGILADLAGLYVDEGHPDQGLELYQRAVDAAPRRAEYRYALAESYVALGRTEDARRTVDQARALRVRDDHFRGAAEDLLVRAALRDAESILEAGPLEQGACTRAHAVMEEAADQLDAGLAAGLDGEVARLDRRHLEELRTRVGRQCGEPET